MGEIKDMTVNGQIKELTHFNINGELYKIVKEAGLSTDNLRDKQILSGEYTPMVGNLTQDGLYKLNGTEGQKSSSSDIFIVWTNELVPVPEDVNDDHIVISFGMHFENENGEWKRFCKTLYRNQSGWKDNFIGECFTLPNNSTEKVCLANVMKAPYGELKYVNGIRYNWVYIRDDLGNEPSNPTPGIDTSDATATALDILFGKTAYVNGNKITGSIPRRAAETITPTTRSITIKAKQYLDGDQTISGDPNLTPENIRNGVSIFGVDGSLVENNGGTDTSDGDITSGDVLYGKVGYSKGSRVVGSILSKSAHTYTPSTTDLTIKAGQYLLGAQTIKGDVNLTSDNIKDGVTIFGVTGNLKSSGGGGSSSGGQDIEIVESLNGAPPKMSKTNGSVEVWGWGEGAREGYTTPRYFLIGNSYRTLSYGITAPTSMSLSISGDGTVIGLPSMVKGEFVAIRRG